MKLMKMSLIACVALGGASTFSLAQNLEDAIRGVDVRGTLSFRYDDDRYKNQGFINDNKRPHGNPASKGDAINYWKAEAIFTTPQVNNVALNLGVYYQNSNNTGHGKGIGGGPNLGQPNANTFLGNGLGAGKDGEFGVSQFNAIIAPDSTNTTITAGKMTLQTPLNDTAEDRGTGISIRNADIPNWNFLAFAYNSWILDDIASGYGNTPNYTSVDKPLYGIAGLSNYDLSFGNISTQLWFLTIKDTLKFGAFGEAAWQNDLFHLKGQYAFAALDTDKDSVPTILHEKSIKGKADLYTLEAGVRFHNFDAYSVPLSLRVGYWGNTQDSFAVSLDNEGSFQKAGQIWIEQFSIGITPDSPGQNLPGSRTKKLGNPKNSLSVFYAAADYDITEKINFGLDFVKGSYAYKDRYPTRFPTTVDNYGTQVGGKRDFYEITPTLVYKHSKQLEFTTFYAMLKTDLNRPVRTFDTSAQAYTTADSQKRNRFRVAATYSF